MKHTLEKFEMELTLLSETKKYLIFADIDIEFEAENNKFNDINSVYISEFTFDFLCVVDRFNDDWQFALQENNKNILLDTIKEQIKNAVQNKLSEELIADYVEEYRENQGNYFEFDKEQYYADKYGN